MDAQDEIARCQAELKRAEIVLAALIQKLGGFVRIEPQFLMTDEPRRLKVWVADDGGLCCQFRPSDAGY